MSENVLGTEPGSRNSGGFVTIDDIPHQSKE